MSRHEDSSTRIVATTYPDMCDSTNDRFPVILSKLSFHPKDIVSKRAVAQRDDCGFATEVGNLADVDASLEEWALVMQSTESYERFVRHAVEEVVKARRMRREQRKEERRRLEEAEEAKGRDAGDAMAGGSARKGSREDAGIEDDDREDRIDILPPHTGEKYAFV